MPRKPYEKGLVLNDEAVPILHHRTAKTTCLWLYPGRVFTARHGSIEQTKKGGRMPLTEFICPDTQKISIADCLKEGGCRMGSRCASRSYLKLVSQERPLHWKCPNCKTETREGKNQKCQ